MKNLTALLLIVALVLAMTACAPSPELPQDTTGPDQTSSTTGPTDPPPTDPPPTDPPPTDPPPTDPPPAHEKFDADTCAKLLGTWSVTVTLDNRLMNFEYFSGKTTFQLYYSFDENGQFSAFVDETEFENAIDTYEQLVIEHMVELRYTTFLGQHEWIGTPYDEIDILWQNGPEMEARGECEDFVATLNLYHRYAKLIREGQYYVEGGKLYTQREEGFEASAYVAGSSSLTLTNTDNPDIYSHLGIRFPFVLKACE